MKYLVTLYLVKRMTIPLVMQFSSVQFEVKFYFINYTTQQQYQTRSTTVKSIIERPPTVNLLPESTAGG